MDEPNLYPIPLNCAPPFPAKFRPPLQKAGDELPYKSHPIQNHLIREHKVDIDDNAWIKTVRQKVNEVQPKVQTDGSCTIFRVPENIRRRGNDDKSYDPVVASIGPYHYFPNQRGMARAMHEYKWRCVRYLLSRHHNRDRASQLLDQCLTRLKELDGKVRNCYAETVFHLDPPKLATVMLIDGCFIIHLLLKQVEDQTAENEMDEETNTVLVSQEEKRKMEVEKGKMKIMEEEEDAVELNIGKGEEEIEGPLTGMLWLWNLVVFDLLKLENQIPFFIVQTIFDIIKTPRDEGIDLVTLAVRLFCDIHPRAFTQTPPIQIHNLLHLFHSSLVPNKHKPSTPASSKPIPRATELKRAGVKFIKKEEAESFLDLTFKNGTLHIPPLRVCDYSSILFKNLIMYEQCVPDVGNYITNYAAFMEFLIGAEEDASLLGSKGIFVNRLGSDEEVVDLFKRRKNHLQYVSDGNYLAEVAIKASKYYESKWLKLRAGLIHIFSSSGRASIVFLAAVILFLLYLMYGQNK